VVPGSPWASEAQGLSSYARALAGIVSWAGAKGQAWRCRRSRAQGLGKPSSPRRKLRSSQARLDLFARGCTQACPMDIALSPRAILKGSVEGSSLFRNHWTQDLTYIYVRISSGAPEPFVASPGVMATKG
jgi:hypothetical protein